MNNNNNNNNNKIGVWLKTGVAERDVEELKVERCQIC